MLLPRPSSGTRDAQANEELKKADEYLRKHLGLGAVAVGASVS